MPQDDRLERFDRYREKMNEMILSEAPLEVKRIFSLDSQIYKEGALPTRTKELLGLVASMVLRCDDCVTYHMKQCVDAHLTDEEIWEAMSIGLLIGGSVVMPHLRRATDTLRQLRSHES